MMQQTMPLNIIPHDDTMSVTDDDDDDDMANPFNVEYDDTDDDMDEKDADMDE